MPEMIVACPFQSSVGIRTENPAVLRNLRLKYGKYLLEGRGGDAAVQISEAGEGEYFAVSPEDTRRVSSPLAFISEYLTHSRTFDPKIFALHGAAVEWGGKAHLFLAATTSGKTTLTAYLTGRGFGYVTDDCILINRHSLAVSPSATPIHLRQGGAEVLRRIGALPEGLEHLDDPGFERWVFTPAHPVTEPLPLGSVFFLHRTEGENRVIPLSTNDAFSRLLKSPITEYPVTVEHLKITSRLAALGACELRYKDMSFAEEVLRDGRF